MNFLASTVPDCRGSHSFKSRSRDTFPTAFDLILHSFSLVTLVVNMHAKFEVSSSNRSRDMEAVQNFKSRSRDPFTAPIDLNLHFFVSAHGV